MPYWSIYCVFCSGFLLDALLECIPESKRSEPAFRRLLKCDPDAALACPYCGGFLGFDDDGKPKIAEPGWLVFRYGLAKLEVKKSADGEPPNTPLTDWALKHRFQQPGTYLPFTDYTYAEQAPANCSMRRRFSSAIGSMTSGIIKKVKAQRSGSSWSTRSFPLILPF